MNVRRVILGFVLAPIAPSFVIVPLLAIAAGAGQRRRSTDWRRAYSMVVFSFAPWLAPWPVLASKDLWASLSRSSIFVPP